jgi:POT family proton-dependent oligopeptide transporter
LTTLTSDATVAAHQADPDDRAFFGHPKGLGWLSFCELWERFSYYGMQTLLVLYLNGYLFKPERIDHVLGMDALRSVIEAVTGPLSVSSLAKQVTGLYVGLVYLMPLFGGLVADRVLGRTRTVVIGATLMAIGHFLMAFESLFLPAIACLLVGVGCFKGNIAAQVGDLYAPGDHRRASAFQIFTLAVQIAVIVAPIACGTLGEKIAWHWGFGLAGVGMVIGLFVYLAGRPTFPPEHGRGQAAEARASASGQAPRAARSAGDLLRVALLVLLIPVLVLTVVGNQQYAIGFPVWAQDHMDLVFFGWQIPITWLQALDAIVSTITMLASIAFWKWWSSQRREPDELTKIALGSFISCFAPAALALASVSVDAGHRIGIGWALLYTLVNDIGFANILPVGLALYSRGAPVRLEGLVIGIYYLHLFVGNSFVGWLGGLTDRMSNVSFWGLHAALVGSAAVLMMLYRAAFGRMIAPSYSGPEATPGHGATAAAH